MKGSSVPNTHTFSNYAQEKEEGLSLSTAISSANSLSVMENIRCKLKSPPKGQEISKVNYLVSILPKAKEKLLF